MGEYPEPFEMMVNGHQVMINEELGHLAVAHDGAITWDALQAIKNVVWGYDARAIEVYPAQCDVINNAPLRHLWRLGADDFCPDLLGRAEPKQTLERRFHMAWEAAQ